MTARQKSLLTSAGLAILAPLLVMLLAAAARNGTAQVVTTRRFESDSARVAGELDAMGKRLGRIDSLVTETNTRQREMACANAPRWCR